MRYASSGSKGKNLAISAIFAILTGTCYIGEMPRGGAYSQVQTKDKKYLLGYIIR